MRVGGGTLLKDEARPASHNTDGRGMHAATIRRLAVRELPCLKAVPDSDPRLLDSGTLVALGLGSITDILGEKSVIACCEGGVAGPHSHLKSKAFTPRYFSENQPNSIRQSETERQVITSTVWQHHKFHEQFYFLFY